MKLVITSPSLGRMERERIEPFQVATEVGQALAVLAAYVCGTGKMASMEVILTAENYQPEVPS